MMPPAADTLLLRLPSKSNKQKIISIYKKHIWAGCSGQHIEGKTDKKLIFTVAAKDEEDSCFSLDWLFTFIRIYFGETLSCQRCFQKMLCVDIKIMMDAIKILLLHTENIHNGSENSAEQT